MAHICCGIILFLRKVFFPAHAKGSQWGSGQSVSEGQTKEDFKVTFYIDRMTELLTIIKPLFFRYTYHYH